METQNSNPNAINTLNSFLKVLKANGFIIGIQSYKDIYEVASAIDNNAEDAPVRLKDSIRVLVCKNETQQDFFDVLYDQHFSKPLPKTLKPTRLPYWDIALVVVFFILAFWVKDHPKCTIVFTPKNAISQPYYNYQGANDSIKTDSLLENQDHYTDLKIQTSLKKNKTGKNQLILEKPGRDTLKIHLTSLLHHFDTVFYYPQVFIAHKKHLSIKPDKEDVYPNDKVTFTATIDTSLKLKHHWTIGDEKIKDTTKGNQSFISKRFLQPGTQKIKIAYETSQDSILKRFPENYYSETIAQEIAPQYSLQVKTLQNSGSFNYVTKDFAILCALLSLAIFIVSLFLFYIYALQKSADAVEDCAEEEKYDGDNMPYQLEFRNRENLIAGNANIVKISRELKKQVESNHFILDLQKTIANTIKNNGLLTLTKKEKQSNRHYLFLINQEYENSQQLRLFQFIMKKLAQEKVVVDFYLYNQEPKYFYSPQQKTTISLSRLQDEHYNANLIILSKGNEFLGYGKPEIDKSLNNLYSFWSKRILITPLSQADWASNERILKTFFSILPADMEGLLLLAQLINDQIDITQIGNLPKQYESKYVDFYEIAPLRDYLNNNELLLQWVCALACFPRLDWNMVLAIGDMILGKEMQLDYPTLLKIVRIEWMDKGSIPCELRFKLLKELSPDNEIKTRQLINQLLEDYPIDEKQFSFEEKRVAQINNNFILYASDATSDVKAKKDHDLFLSRYNKNQIMDFSLVRYIEMNPNDVDESGSKWQTPIKNSNHKNVALKDYIQSGNRSQTKARLILFAAIALLVAGIWPLEILRRVDVAVDKYEKTTIAGYALVQKRLGQSWITFTPNDCSRFLADSLKDNAISVAIENGKTTRISLKDSIKIQTAAKFKIFGKIGNNSINVVKTFDPNLNYSIAVKGQCKIIPDNNLVYLQYFPQRIKDSVAEFQEKLTEMKFNIAPEIDYEDTNYKNEVRYFIQKDKAQAQKYAGLAGVFFSTPFQTNFVTSKAYKTAKHIEIWIKRALHISSNYPVPAAFSKVIRSSGNYELKIANSNSKQTPNCVRYYSTENKKYAHEIASKLIAANVGIKAIEFVNATKKYDFEICNSSKYLNCTTLTQADLSITAAQNVSKCSDCESKQNDANHVTVYFDYDKFSINPEARMTLQNLSERLKKYPNQKVQCNGFASGNAAAYNSNLSNRLANAVVQYLVENGISKSRIVAKGYGNSTLNNASHCQKVEIIITGQKILWLEEKPGSNAVLIAVLKDNGIEVTKVGTAEQAMHYLQKYNFDYIITESDSDFLDQYAAAKYDKDNVIIFFPEISKIDPHNFTENGYNNLIDNKKTLQNFILKK